MRIKLIRNYLKYKREYDSVEHMSLCPDEDDRILLALKANNRIKYVCLYRDGTVQWIEYRSGDKRLSLCPNGWCRLYFRFSDDYPVIVVYTTTDDCEELKDIHIDIDSIKKLGLDPRVVAEDWKYTPYFVSNFTHPTSHTWINPDNTQMILIADDHINYFTKGKSKWILQEKVNR